MAEHAPDDESVWAAEKRDFVADHRDDLAAERDEVADARDLTADARESALDERERLLDLRASRLAFAPDATERAERAGASHAREQARQGREQAHEDRDEAADARDEAAGLRQEARPTTRLAATFAAIAENLYGADSYDAVLHRIAQAAVDTVAGCEMASVTLFEKGAYRTAASTAANASAVDRAQYVAGEGPCLDAVEAPVVYARAFPDPRWPTLGSRPVELGACAAASYRLASAGSPRVGDPTRTGTTGSLNTYGSTPDAFSAEAQQIGLILAAHASMAAAVVRERSHLHDQTQQLSEALVSRDVIGQAKGILMERLKLTPEQAFDALRHSSKRLNEKLRTVASTLAETGEFDAGKIPRT
ncbi:ANTAR domain-containing protein [Intrasporangium sp. YIM S08009]|uniref:ANTAR domain-containing protein n=1 Tax=Intrasporangium zincisolvens TaxID=3080018 RepID=UPI002B056E1E|nr:ANTAR domain-containing protein [Intrasporangium sp. YIM S08009]